MSLSTPTPSWDIPKPTALGILLATLRRSLLYAAVLSVVFVLYKALMLYVADDPARPIDLAELTSNAAYLFFFFAMGLYPLLLCWATRPLSDRSFRIVGFAATFSGLFLLGVFFTGIAVDVAEWFHYTPILVTERNVYLKELEKRLENLGQMRAEKLADVNKELERELSQAPTEAEKKELREIFEKQVIPEQVADFDKTLNELKQEAGEQRSDNSAWGIFLYFLSNGPSYRAQDAGIYPALLGSLWLGLITILFAVPVGVGAAIYLEEFKSSRPWIAFVQNLIQININNLAGVPSVVFGILGAFVFVELIFKPLESPNIAARNVLGGGLTLGLLTLPVVIVSAQEAIRAVPSSLRHGSYALGATHWQTIWTIVLPMARPGIMTGSILSLSRAIGEAAPLVLFGALLFVNQDPSLFSRFTIMPMQIFNWADRPPEMIQGESVEIWKYNAAVAIVLLLVMLLTLNGIAIYLRNRAQKQYRY